MTQENKHTPAPWKVFKTIDGLKIMGIGQAETAEGITDYQFNLWGGVEDDYYEANAHLIAAAPELLEALVRARDFVDRHSEEWYKSGQDLLKTLDLTIAKAKGVTNETN
jgi:hypothetical protein